MSMKCIRRLGVGLVMVMVLGCMAGAAMAEQSVASKIRQMTGARTKIAWIRASGGKGHPFGAGMEPGDNVIWRIVVIDTDGNGGAERYLIDKLGAYSHIEITPSGKRVLYASQGAVWVIDWDGKNQRKLLDKAATVAVAEDPPGTEWVYVKEAENSNKIPAGIPLPDRRPDQEGTGLGQEQHQRQVGSLAGRQVRGHPLERRAGGHLRSAQRGSPVGVRWRVHAGHGAGPEPGHEHAGPEPQRHLRVQPGRLQQTVH